MKNLLSLIFFALPLSVLADPAPFGLEIGKATIKEVTTKYRAQKSGINKYSNGDMYELSGIEFDKLKKVTAIFNKDEKLVAILATLSKVKFTSLLNSLSNKYQLISKKEPFVGDKFAKLVDGNTEISLNAPHMGFDMNMDYISKDLWSSYESQSNAEQKQQQQREESKL